MSLKFIVLPSLDRWQIVHLETGTVIKEGVRCPYCGMIYGRGVCTDTPPSRCCEAARR